MLRQTLKSDERLKSEKTIGLLFKSGYSVMAYPLLFIFMPLVEPETHHKVMVSVSKKKFKRAVKRNLIKRRLREVYRLNKQCISGLSCKHHWAIGVIYIGKEILAYRRIESAYRIGAQKMTRITIEKGDHGSAKNTKA